MPRTNAFALLVPAAAHQTFSSLPLPAIANAAQSIANHDSTGMVRIANASATSLALHAIQLSIGTRSIVHASVSMMIATALKTNTSIMILAHANVRQVKLANQMLVIILTSTSVPPLIVMEIVNGDVTLSKAAMQMNTSMTLNANVSANHTLAVT